jgi:ComF family protein
MKLKEFWQQIISPMGWGNLGNALLKTNCPGCQRLTSDVICLYCFRQLQSQQLLDFKILEQAPFSLFAWGYYGGSLKRVLASLKYQNQRQLGPWLGELLATAWLTPQRQQLDWCRTLPASLVVVPIPLHAEKLKKRGFNQSLLIAQGFCHQTTLPLLAEGLVRLRPTSPQFGLTEQQRQENLAGAFALGSDWAGGGRRRQVLLLDDIFTTGATIASASQVLSAAGIPVWGTVTLAFTPLNKAR